MVLVVATGGEAGLSDGAPGTGLGARRADELDRSAAALGCAKVIRLDYPDSGMHNEHHGFASMPVEEPAERLAAILRAERADALTVYDRNGGYGHPDHVQVHRVGHRAAELAGTRLVLEATVDRTALVRALSLVRWTRLLPPDFAADRLRHSYSDRAAITHRIDVRAFAGAKRRSMAAHASQAAGGAVAPDPGVLPEAARPALPPGLRRRVVHRGRPGTGPAAGVGPVRQPALTGRDRGIGSGLDSSADVT